MGNASVPIQERLEEFYRRLDKASSAKSADEAFKLVCDTLNQVEDELSGIPCKNPPASPSKPDGRMYPPQEDYTKRNNDGSIEARSKGHKIEIGSNGSITIINKKTQKIEFQK
ncbi:MAG: hypothetical protein QNJ60_09730 [Xenococcaceae cyanobacterium MO_188.B19]|nr:hypothetical protein [Xenococcaceae cyanobacterium MO_188.B19]